MTTRHGGRRDTAARAALAPLVAAGTTCWRCGLPIDPGQPWDAGHLDDLATGGHPAGRRLPEHRRCNRAAGAVLGRLLRPLTRAQRIRPW